MVSLWSMRTVMMIRHGMVVDVDVAVDVVDKSRKLVVVAVVVVVIVVMEMIVHF